MKDYNFIGCESLSFNDMVTIDGGSPYDAGHAIGQAIHDFCEGVWDGLCGK